MSPPPKTPPQDEPTDGSPPGGSSRTYCHQAMATTFCLYVRHENETYARQTAALLFRELDDLEHSLSRFHENSELSRVQRLGADRPVPVQPDVLAFFQIAEMMRRRTHGAFDLSAGSPEPPPPDEPVVLSDPESGTVRLSRPGLRLDPGAIGKGFALDRLVAQLVETWDLPRALASAGGSTMLARDPPAPRSDGWRVRMESARGHRHLRITRQAISASGIAWRGNHILDPRSGAPVHRYTRTWALAPTAAEADALSTAFMVMTEEEIDALVQRHPEYAARLLVTTPNGERQIITFGTGFPA